MIEITATAESLEQAKSLLEANIDVLLIGEERFGLRLPTDFSREDQRKLTEMAHQAGKKVSVAVNAIMHPDKMKEIPEYLAFLDEINVDRILVGDPGVIYVLQKNGYQLPYVYDGETLVTSARQINFWGRKGAVGAVVAREVPYLELVDMADQLDIFGEILVYGATCIHQSKRLLVRNFFSYIGSEESVGRERNLFISEPKKEETHYSIYEDSNGTHIFADNDVDLMLELDKLIAHQYNHWKLDGLYTPGAQFVEVAKCFVEAKQLLEQGKWSDAEAARLNQKVQASHPSERGLDEGFFLIDPESIK